MSNIPAAEAPAAGLDGATRIAIKAALCCAVLQAFGPPRPFSVVTSFVLLVLAPGFVLARGLRVDDPVLLIVLTVATSMTLDVLTATLLLYLGIWSAPTFAVSMGLVTVMAAVLIARVQRRWETP